MPSGASGQPLSSATGYSEPHADVGLWSPVLPSPQVAATHLPVPSLLPLPRHEGSVFLAFTGSGWGEGGTGESPSLQPW